MNQRSTPAVGIDLGTTNSVLAYRDATGRPITVLNAEGDLTTPSVVYFHPSAVVVGKEAAKMALFEPQRVAQYAKRDIGSQSYHRRVCGQHLPPEVVEALVLQKVVADARPRLGALEKVVVTVPAYFNEPRRKATQDAGRLAGLQVIDIINEPTAAAIAFGVQEGFLSDQAVARYRERILVYDLGGGTFDATLMELCGRRFQALGTAGDVHLGGIDWNQRLADYLAATFLETHGIDVRRDAIAAQTLLAEAEDAKRALTTRDAVDIHLAFEGRRLGVHVTREMFEHMTEDLVARTSFTVNKLLRDAALEWNDVTRVLMVGGSTRMPMIQEMLRRESGQEPDRSLSPDEAVAHGAAIYADLILNSSDRPQIDVTNVNSHNLGVLGVEKGTGRPRTQILIPRNTPLPARGVGKFVTAKANQSSVAVRVVEGGDASGQHATPIGKCVVRDLPQLPEGTSVEVRFRYTADGRLSVKAWLPHARSEASLVIERAAGMSDSAIELWRQRIAEGLRLEPPTPAPPPVAREHDQDFDCDQPSVSAAAHVAAAADVPSSAADGDIAESLLDDTDEVRSPAAPVAGSPAIEPPVESPSSESGSDDALNDFLGQFR